MGTFFRHVLIAGIELDYPLKLPGGHIPWSYFIHVGIAGVQ
jgi:hypothetical protein